MNSWPSFSVIICNFNYAQFVGQAIQSVLDQHYPTDRLQVIVVDDGSTDGSHLVYQPFAHDPRFLAVLQENRGQTAAFEAGVQVATGDYVCLLDSDDLFVPHKLERVAARIAQLAEAPDNLFMCHDLVLEDITDAIPLKQAQTWFDVVGINRLPDSFTLTQQAMHFPFSIPSGLVFSRPVISACLEAIPAWAFPRGADGVVCPAALFKTGRVHYLREPLGVYRIHRDNEFATLVNGRYTPRFNPQGRAPKTLYFLEQWIDTLDQPAPQRALALDYLRRFEHLGRRLSASRKLTEPRVSVAVLGLAGRHDDAARESISASLQSHGYVDFQSAADPELPELQQMARAYAASDGEYMVFMRAGDRLDREFVERHLYWRQHGALVGLSCSDVRLASSAGSLVHADVLRNSGAWKQNLQQVPPLATTLRDWVAPPMSACMFRRNALLDRLFARRGDMPDELQDAGFWLVFQFQHHTSGVLRILETLTTCRLPEGAAATYAYLSAPSGSSGTLVDPPVFSAAAWLTQFYQDEPALFQQWLPASWHQRFGPWLAAHMGTVTHGRP
ncbi:MAG: glycosyltransferase family 2 protein [Rhodoferax sp.]|nr:glycosyltransferase family 2 protein [Rhodoferax sp.]